MDCSAFSGGYSSGVSKSSGPRRRSDGRLAVICGGAQLRVPAGGFHMLSLRGYGRDVSLASGSFFLRSGTVVSPAAAAVKADAIT